VLDAWSLMGGQIDWSALPFLVELYGIRDPDIFLAELVAVREYVQRVNK